MQQLWQLRSQLAARIINVHLVTDRTNCWQSELALLVCKTDEWIENHTRLGIASGISAYVVAVDDFTGDRRRLWRGKVR